MVNKNKMKSSTTSRTKVLDSRQDLKNLEVSNIHFKKMNKKGFLRILEAIIAVLIILSALLFVVIKNNSEKSSADSLCLEANSLIDEISKNSTLREGVLNSDVDLVKGFLVDKISNPLIDYRVKICKLDDFCSLNEGGLDKVEICASERLISTTTGRTDFQPKKLKIFLFRLS